MSNFVAVLIAALLPLVVSAQIRKCVDSAGKTVYSDIVCLDTTARETLIDGYANGAPPIPRAIRAEVAPPAGRSAIDQQLRNKIAEHIARKDFARAMDLAVTEEQFAMITAAQRQQDSDKAARRAAGPTVCATSGYAQGNAYTYGRNTSLSGTYSGTTVCNKARGGGNEGASQKFTQDYYKKELERGKQQADFYRDLARRP